MLRVLLGSTTNSPECPRTIGIGCRFGMYTYRVRKRNARLRCGSAATSAALCGSSHEFRELATSGKRPWFGDQGLSGPTGIQKLFSLEVRRSFTCTIIRSSSPPLTCHVR